MNVLLLTPDAVGSTLLQRLITIYMQFHDYGSPVINVHEITNGLIRYWNQDFNREMLGKQGDKVGYYQTLPEIMDLLEQADHYKIGRLAEYHLKSREDPREHLVPFYRFLDDNFYIVSCRRANMFEHALSMCLNRITKRLNVFGAWDKIDTFLDLYRESVHIDANVFGAILCEYKSYLEWSERHFKIGSYFYYDRDLDSVEEWIAKQPMFAGRDKKTWQQTFGISFKHWNLCHYYGSNLGALLEQKQTMPLLTHDLRLDRQEQDFPLASLLPREQAEWVERNREGYRSVSASIERMNELGILNSTLPVKKQTLKEKLAMIKNINELVDCYNQWTQDNPGVAESTDQDRLFQQMQAEQESWSVPCIGTDLVKT